MVPPGAALPLPELRAFAEELADAADVISTDRFGGPLPVDTKPDGSPVTEADLAIESALRARIGSRWPEHAMLGEEEGGALAPERPTWVVDPIDGTKNFLRGVPVWATLIALVVGGRPVLGVASAPALGERWVAAEGYGATRNDAPVTVSGIREVADAHVLHGGLDWYRQTPGGWEMLGAIADEAWRTRGFGDYWMHLLVASGAADVAFERDLKLWDMAALVCIVTEAGGRCTGWDGAPALEGSELLTTNGVLHEAMMRRLTRES